MKLSIATKIKRRYEILDKRFKIVLVRAVAYARSMIHPVKKEEYQKKLPKGKRVYNAALQEFLSMIRRLASS